MLRLLPGLGGTLLLVAACLSPSSPPPATDAPPSPSPVVTAAVSPSPVVTAAVSPSAPVMPSPTPGAGEMVISQRLSDSSRIFYTEGAIAFVEIRNGSGTLVDEIQTAEYRSDIELVRVQLVAGQYELTSYVRPCLAACPAMDPPNDECTADVTVASGRTVEVVIERTVGEPCVVYTTP